MGVKSLPEAFELVNAHARKAVRDFPSTQTQDLHRRMGHRRSGRQLPDSRRGQGVQARFLTGRLNRSVRL